MWLRNNSGEAREYMWNGQPFSFAPGELKHITPDEAGRHLLQHLGRVGLAVAEEPRQEEVKPPREQAVCPLCGADFGDRRKPGYSLRMHIPKCPKLNKQVEDEEPGVE